MSLALSRKPRPGSLRPVAEEIEQATGLQVEIIGGSLVMSPTPRGKHAGVIYRLEQLIRPKLSADLAAFEVASVEMPDDPDDYCTPDLIVGPSGFLDSEEWLLAPADVTLAVEVISRSETGRKVEWKIDWYARAGLQRLLVMDPHAASWALHTNPHAGEFTDVQRGVFGDPVHLPDPINLPLETANLPRYDK